MGIIIYKLFQLVLLTFAIGFFIAFIIQLIKIIIQSEESIRNFNFPKVKCYYRAVKIRRLRNNRCMSDTNDSNDLIRYYYGAENHGNTTI